MKKAAVPSILVAVVLLAVGVIAEAQQPKKVPRIGFLSTTPALSAPLLEAFRQGLRELGYVEGKNIVFEFRYAEEKLDRLPELAAELVRLKVDVIVAAQRCGDPAAKKATKTIPIVMVQYRRSCCAGLGCQPRATRRKHHGPYQSSPRAERETAGAAQGSHSASSPAWRSSGIQQSRHASYERKRDCGASFGLQLHSLEVTTAR